MVFPIAVERKLKALQPLWVCPVRASMQTQVDVDEWADYGMVSVDNRLCLCEPESDDF